MVELMEEGNLWPDVDGFETMIVSSSSCRSSSLKPALEMRPALEEDMDSSSCCSNRMNSAFPGASCKRSVVPLAPAAKKIRIEVPAATRYFEAMFSLKKKNSKRCGSRSDAVLALRGSVCELQNSEGKTIWKGKAPASKEIKENSEFEVQNYVVDVMDEISENDFATGKVFASAFPQISSTITEESDTVSSAQHLPRNTQTPSSDQPNSALDEEDNKLVLNTAEYNDGTVSVTVDPYIASKLRPHQREGVKFMYECVMGLKSSSFTGCLLADEMGLGKTLQVIALVWTLLRQGPRGVPAVRRAVIICPSTLIQNWGKEVRKWLGTERLKAIVVDSPKEAERKFLNFRNDNFCPLLITSYETLRKHKDVIASSKPQLLVCDEAHRLKSCKRNKTIDSLLSLHCEKTILLTGTPVQNNLSEFYAILDFANPNILGPYSEFKALYAGPIERSRDRNASDSEKDLGLERMEELKRRTSFCILRRTADVNLKYLPAKTEYVVFCKLQTFQIILYEMFLKSQFVRKLLITDFPPATHVAHVLSAIGALKKLCNHPALVQSDMKYVTSPEIMNHPSYNAVQEFLDISGNSAALRDGIGRDWNSSGKFVCLMQLLSSAIECNDRVVVASNYTQTLDLIQLMCDEKRWKYARLDGSTTISERQPLVERFNRGIGNEAVFLLSSKAGGTGLNLIGANRLVLVDPDWNPAVDSQAMSRVWREGQKKPVVIYRLLSTGSIEEKIYQRQIMKTEMSSVVGEEVKFGQLGGKNSGQKFSRKELRELLSLRLDTKCETFDILSRANGSLEEKWRDSSADVDDHVLRKAFDSGVVTFVSASAVTTQTL